MGHCWFATQPSVQSNTRPPQIHSTSADIQGLDETLNLAVGGPVELPAAVNLPDRPTKCFHALAQDIELLRSA